MLPIHVRSVVVVLSTRLVARTPRRKAASAINDHLSGSSTNSANRGFAFAQLSAAWFLYWQ